MITLNGLDVNASRSSRCVHARGSYPLIHFLRWRGRWVLLYWSAVLKGVTQDVAGAEEFRLPPRVRNARGEVRRAGFELEYTGVSIAESARIVRDVFGFEDEDVQSTFARTVRTPAGEFAVEIDTRILKDKTYEKPLRALGIEPDPDDRDWLEHALLDVASTVVPIEIGAPPLPITDLTALDALRTRLLAAGAKGTRASLLYAFGMHINPEIPSDDPGVLRDYLRAFLLLYPWLKDRCEVDISRSVTPYINRFPSDYARLILRGDYPASSDRLIDDYLQYNPTRNRPLDMLPVLAHLDRDRVLAGVEDGGKLVKPRPAFHYRLPNCELDDPTWTLAGEWNTWVAVERLAADAERIAAMSRDYFAADEESFRPFYDKWPDVVERHMQGE